MRLLPAISFQNASGGIVSGAGRRNLALTGPSRARTLRFCQTVLRARGWEPCEEPSARVDTLLVTGVDEFTSDYAQQLGYHSNRAVPYALLNIDDPRVAGSFAQRRVPFITFGRNPDAHIRCHSVRRGESGTTVDVQTPVGNQEFYVPEIGVDCGTSVLAAVALGLALRIDLEMIASALGAGIAQGAGLVSAA